MNTNPNMALKTSSKNSSKRLPASIGDELSCTLAIKCYDTVNSMSSMKVSEQHEMMFKLYHGHQGSEGISNFDLMCKGLSPFDDLFEDAGLST